MKTVYRQIDVEWKPFKRQMEVERRPNRGRWRLNGGCIETDKG